MSSTLQKNLLFLFQIIAHVGLFYGIFNFTFTEWSLVFFIYFLTGCLGVSITYHRYLSHKSFKTNSIFLKIGILFATYGIVGSSLAWVNTHRKHHRYTDQPKDPHSPMVYGYLKSQWLSMYTSADSMKYVIEYINDTWQMFIHRHYYLIHSLILFLFLFFTDFHTASVYYLAPAAILWYMGSMINTICHSGLGYKNHILKDRSTNNFFLGFFVWGEGWHNNHHYMPARPKFGERWFEIDISYLIINLIKK